jgi:hypothetical protein
MAVFIVVIGGGHMIDPIFDPLFCKRNQNACFPSQMQMMLLLIKSVGARHVRGNSASSTNNPVVTTGTATTAMNSNKGKQILSDVDTTIK